MTKTAPSQASGDALATQLELDADLTRTGAEFRPVQYLGSKWRLLDAIDDAVQSVAGAAGLVCDLFSGTGVVAARLSQANAVLAADIQEYARTLASAMLHPASDLKGATDRIKQRAREHEAELRTPAVRALIENEAEALGEGASGQAAALCDVLEHGSILGHRLNPDAAPVGLAPLLDRAGRELGDGPGTVLTRYYGGIYFSYEQAVSLDALAQAIRAESGAARDVLLAALLSTTSEVVSTVGSQFAQPVRPRTRDGDLKVGFANSVARARTRAVPLAFEAWIRRYGALRAPAFPCNAVRADFRDVLSDLPSQVTAVYADPPYTRDHYSRYYHVLETIALGDEPQISLVTVGSERKLSRGIYRAERHQSPFCIKSQAPDAFEALFVGVSKANVPLVLSYSPYAETTRARPRLMTIDQISALAAEYFARIEVQSVGRVAHSKFNAERMNAEVSYDAEVLIVCEA